MEFLPSDEALRLANSSYYRQKGRRIYKDFSTVVKCCPLVAQADALDFVQRRQGRGGERQKLEIYEFGTGDGTFAFDFLDDVKKQNKGIYSRMDYTLCDISAKLLRETMESERARRHLGRLHKLETDAAGEFSFSADYVRSNELYDDLPAKLLVLKKGRVYEVFLAAAEAGEEVRKKMCETGGEFPQAFIKMLLRCEGRELVYNFGALAHLRNAMRALKKGGWVDIYDYGYADVSEAEETPPEIWNAGTVREYGAHSAQGGMAPLSQRSGKEGGQLTVDVNFALLREEAEKCGCKVTVEPVSGRLEEIFGRKFTYVDFVAGGKGRWVGYVDAEGLKARRAELKKAGYSEEFLRGEAEEEDCYLHMRAEKI
ncbi:MAG: SAM-dependent methyltransferase [Candidatus Burarchaeum sp.]|nr:SAM-dependent methyltransferase [Candidatus Burarchaeum sp.]MDO8339133.1 SAM-dependent methyltransferase [Candidatus Burarchaeum sp.]